MAGFFISGFKLNVNGAALRSVLGNPYGPVGVELLGEAEQVLEHAQAHCPVESEEQAARHKREAGRLRASLHIKREELSALGHGVFYLIGSDLEYARRIEFHPTVGGFLRGALATAAGSGRLAAISPAAEVV